MSKLTGLGTYQYTPLAQGHIRVLELETESTNSPVLTYSLKTIPFGDQAHLHAPYDALSYAWGDTSQKHLLTCDAHELYVHKNLHEALPYLARRPSRLPLWIDAVCIDQANEREKMDQIRLMAQIYQGAVTVWAWLGIPVEPGATEAVNVILPCVVTSAERIAALPDDTWLSPSVLGLPDLESPAWDAFDQITNNPWFSRLWVIQEAARAKHLQFLHGDIVIEYALLQEAIKQVSKLRSIRDGHGNRPRHWNGLLTLSGNLFKCVDLAQDNDVPGSEGRNADAANMGLISAYTSDSLCSDPKDRVLALIGLLSKEDIQKFHFDHHTSIKDLYMQFVQFVLHRKDVDWAGWDAMLEQAISTRGQCAGFPTWCPDLHACAKSVTRPFIRKGAHQASTRPRWSRPGCTMCEIVVRGKIVDCITGLGAPYRIPEAPGRSYLIDWIAMLERWERKASCLASCIRQHRSFTEHDYWRTLLADHKLGPDSDLKPEHFLDLKTYAADMVTLVERIGVDRVHHNLETKDVALHHNPFTDAEDADLNVMIDRLGFIDRQAKRTRGASIFYVLMQLGSIQDGCTMFSTASHRLGHSNGDIRTGDKVVIFDGAKVPYVLRSSAGAKDDFELVGVAYLHGVMHGEADTWDVPSHDITLV